MSAQAHRPGLVVAIDGPSGSGKSSVARGIAHRYGLRYLDTGAMYRAMAWWMLAVGVDVDDAGAVAESCAHPDIVVRTSPEHPGVSVDDHDVTREIRSEDVTRAVSPVSAVPEVRERLVTLQRQIIGTGDIVVEGRDIGSVVAPSAQVKVFLTASAEARARRRHAELASGSGVEQTQRSLARRDHLDSTRAASPLAQAPGAVLIDATQLSLEQVIETVSALVESATTSTSQEGAL